MTIPDPADHCYTLLAWYGEEQGWGPLAIAMPPLLPYPVPFVYTGELEFVVETIAAAAQQRAQVSGQPTRLVRFERRVDVYVFGGSN